LYSGFISNVLVDDTLMRNKTLDSADALSIDNRAKTKLRNNLKDQKINLVQALAERKQTVDLFVNAATRIANALSHLKRGDIVGAAESFGIKASKRMSKRFARDFRRSQSKAISNGWLELQYGWRPLLSDVFGAAEAIAQSRYGYPTGKVSSSITTVRTYTERFQEDPQFVPENRTWELRYTRKYVCYFRLTNDVLVQFNKLGLTNPALIAWELTPYSFVVDWFLPIGNWLNSMDATLGVEFLRGSATTFRKCRGHAVWNGTVKRTSDTKTVTAEAAHEWVDMDRTVLTVWPSVGFPAFKNPLGLEHLSNAMALLTQHLRK